MSITQDEISIDLDPLAESIEALQAIMFRNRSKGNAFEVSIIDNGNEPDAIACEVKITGDTVGDRKKLEKYYLKKNWTCVTDANDDKKTTCTSPK